MATSRRFLFLTQTYPRFEGDTAGPFIRDLARALVAGGDEVTVLLPHAEDVAASWDDGGVEVRSFRYAPEAMELVGYSRSLEADETMKRGAMLAAPLYWVGARRAVAKELRRKKYDLVQAHWLVPNALAAAAFAQRIPVAVGLHGSDVFLAERREIGPWVRRTLRRTSVVTGCSPELVNRVCALGFDKAYARVIPYGVDSKIFSPDYSRRPRWREKLGIPDDAPMAVSVGRMATKKGYQVLLGSLDRLMEGNPRLHLVLEGAGDRLDEFRERAGRWQTRVHFPGVVLRGTLPDLYRAADLFVLPAVHDPQGNVDGLPNVILESMASGLPVVASSVSGIPLAVKDGKNGRLVPEFDGDATVDAMLDVASDLERARAMGAAGREVAVAELSWSAVAGRYRQAYELALGAH
ncbi:MAG: glycosyltransferase [Acidobacteriota bacterium]